MFGFLLGFFAYSIALRRIPLLKGSMQWIRSLGGISISFISMYGFIYIF